MKKLQLADRISFEKETVERMLQIYCSHHHERSGLCETCHELREYSFARIEKCPLRPEKPVCAACKVHCYKPLMRERIKLVMRFSGPRMVYKAPVKAITYLLIKKRLLAG